MTNSKRTSFSKTGIKQLQRNKTQIMVYKGTERSCDSSLVPHPKTQTPLKQSFSATRQEAIWKTERQKGAGLLGTVRKVRMGRADLAALAALGFYHIYKYIHKYITYNSLGGRLPAEVQESRKGHWAPRNVFHMFSPAQGKPCPKPTPPSAV